MIGSIILVVLGVMALIGLGSMAVKDFDIPVLALVLVFAAIVGLNFIPAMTVGGFTFRWGTALMFLMTALLWLFKGRTGNKVLCFLITVLLAGLTYGATRLSLIFDNSFWGSVNVFYALIVGALAFLITRNAKYGFISGALAIMTATLLTQIGSPVINLEATYSWSIVAGSLAVVLFSFVTKLLPSRPSKASYYFETGRMLDEKD